MSIDLITGEILPEPVPVPVGGRSGSLMGPSNYDKSAVSNETALSFVNTKSLAQQQFKEESDINTIVERFGLTGQLPENPHAPVYGDFVGIDDYQTALNAVMEADERFMEFPAQLRARFENDPQRLLVFLADPNNRAEAERLGLVKAPPPVVVKEEVATPGNSAST